MARRRCKTSMPVDVLEEIFSWLPPTSLILMKCVNKSWYSHINSLMKNPKFVNKHLLNIDRKIVSSAKSIVFNCIREEDPFHSEIFSLLTVFHDDNENDHLNYVIEDFGLPFPPDESDMCCVVAYHCNGIICLIGENQRVMLCNPAIKESRILPEPCLCYDDFQLLEAGIYYDSRANDYKVIRFGFSKLLLDTTEDDQCKADLYSMGTDSWREIGIHLDISSYAIPSRGVFCQGVFYWPIHDDGYVIISFDVFDEVFRTLSLPDCLIEKVDGVIQFDVCNESVTLFSFPIAIEVPGPIEVWVLDDCIGGVKGSYSWIKKLNIGSLVDVQNPWTFWKTDELLLESSDGGLISYNLQSQILRKLSIQGFERMNVCQASYVESLVSVKGGQEAH